MQAFLGSSVTQVEQITCIADVAGASAGKYFLFHTVAGLKKYIWLKVGASVDPAPIGGWTGTMVTVVSGDSAATIATNVAAAMVSSGTLATASGAVVTRTHTTAGYAPPSRDSDLEPTGFAFSLIVKGDVETDVGYTSGGFKVSGLTKSKQTIKADQTGETELGDVITGTAKPEVAFTLQETDKNSIRNYLLSAGSTTYVPEGVGKVEVVGYGSEGIGSPTPVKRLRLHPIALGTADMSKDVVFWNAALDIDSFDFSGTKFSEVPVKLSIYPDFSKHGSAQYFIIGDPTNI